MKIQDLIEENTCLVEILQELDEVLSGESVEHHNTVDKDEICIYVSYNGFNAVNKAMELQSLGWKFISQAMKKSTGCGKDVMVTVYFT